MLLNRVAMGWSQEHFQRVLNTLRAGQLDPPRRPVAWVGAGLSIPAGYPSWFQLAEILRKASRIPLAPEARGTGLIELFIKHNGKGDLGDVLARILPYRPPPEMHRQLVRLPWRLIATTNYDELLEDACKDDKSSLGPFVTTVEHNIDVIPPQNRVLIFKPHGDVHDLAKIILDQTSYAEYPERYPKAIEELNGILRRRSVVFFGCSMTDPRLLDWLGTLSRDERQRLKSSVTVMAKKDWASLDLRVRDLLQTSNIFPCLVDDYGDIQQLIASLYRELAEVSASLFVQEPADVVVKGPDKSFFPKLCNRTDQARLVLKSLKADATLTGPPRIYCIFGREVARPRSLAERLWVREVRAHAEKRWSVSVGVLGLKKLSWPEIGDADLIYDTLISDAFRALDGDARSVSGCSAREWSARFAGSPYRLVGISYDIPSHVWDSESQHAMTKYLKFWSDVANHKQPPRVVLFLNFISFQLIPTMASIRAYLSVRWFCGRHVCRPVTIARLRAVNRRDVRVWISTYFKECEPDVADRVLSRIFGRYPRRAMMTVERELKRIVQEATE